MSEIAPFVWREPFRIRAYEVGPDERGTVLTVCTLFQEAAGAHARHAGVETFRLPSGPGTWVLHRLRVRLVDRPAMLEEVAFETWPSDRDGLRATRDFVCTGADGREIARGTSAWLVLDVARRRATRLPEAIEAFGPPERPRALTFDGAPPEPGVALLAEQTFPVRRSDLDRVGHANNVRFVEWALEAVPDPWISGRTLLDVDITYAAEAVRGDAVQSVATVLSPTVLAHHLTRERDGRMLARATTTWTPP